MLKKKVYDLPTRIFHWLFAASFLGAYFIGEFVDDESSLYSYHMLLGFFMTFLVFLRVFWGLFGSKYARFTSFRLVPRELLEYISSVVSTKSKRYLGHNPASSYAAILMFLFTLGLGFSGVLMVNGIAGDVFEDIHELCATGFIIAVVFHILGVVLHQLKHRDGLGSSMITGVKHEVKGEDEIQSNHPFVAIIFIGLVLIFSLYLNRNYNSRSQEFNFFGTRIELSEDSH